MLFRSNRNAKIQNIPFEKTGEDDCSVTYAATVQMNESNELRIEYTGEWARIAVGDKEYGFIGGVAIIPASELSRLDNTEQTIKITVYKNLAFTMRDDLSKFDILRPAELKSVCIIEK